jgi:hypothetical protein
MGKLKINNIDVSLGSSKIVLNKSAYSVDSWLAKQVTYSERVRLPQTAELDGLFLRPKNTGIAGRKFSDFYRFQYSDNGKILFEGVAKLLGCNKSNEYELQLFDSSFALFDALKNDLNALSVDIDDFVFNASEYALKKVFNSSVWIWSASNQHEKRTLSNNVLSGNLAFSRPFFSVQRLMERMFSANFWTYSNSTNSELINKLILASNNKQFYFTSYDKNFSSSIVSPSVLDLTGYNFIKDSITGTTQLDTDYTSALRFRGWVTSENDLTLRFSGISSTTVDTQTQDFVINAGRFYYDFTTDEFETDDATYNITVELIGSGNVDFDNVLLYTIIEENNFGDISLGNFIDYKVKTYDNLPKISQIDLFKHILVSVGGFFTSDNLRKNIKINSLNEISRLGAEDWSQKIDENSISIVNASGYGRINYYNYDNSDEKPLNLGRGNFLIDSNTIKETSNVYNSIFSASAEVFIDSNNQIDAPVYSDIERLNDLNDILGYYENVSTYTVARFADLNGNNTLLNYYNNYINAIQNGAVITANFNLNKSDFFLFDFTKSVYIDQLNSNFYQLTLLKF